MTVLGVELCDAGFQATTYDGGQLGAAYPEGGAGVLGWMGLGYHDGRKCWFGPAAEEAWFVRPRQVSHHCWSRLSHEPSSLGTPGHPLSYSQLAFHCLREYHEQATAALGAAEKLVLAVPGDYLKDAATEDERIGLLLGMAAELRLPLAGIIDMACAAICDPRLDYCDRTMPLLVVDVHLRGAELTLLHPGERFARHDYTYLPQAGYADLLRQVTAMMGNRFLRHTTFDIQEDGSIEQAFYQQTKAFLLSGRAEHRYQINTGNRNYEMTATRDQLATDTSAMGQHLLQGALAMLQRTMSKRAGSCTVALTARTNLLPGIAVLFRAAGLTRLLRLPAGAAAAGAARVGADRPRLERLDEVPVDTVVPVALTQRRQARRCEISLLKARRPGGPSRPTHVVCEGTGRALEGHADFVIAAGGVPSDLALPEEFDPAGEGCLIRLEREDDRWWLVGSSGTGADDRALVEAGDRLAVHFGSCEAEVLFVSCSEDPGLRRRRD